MPEFVEFPKIARYSREVIITEKIDGTNAQIFIDTDNTIYAGSRTRWIAPGCDHMGFAKWVEAHKDELLTLGPGRHFGEWWGQGIQRGYGLKEKRLSLFNVTRWCLYGQEPQELPSGKKQDILPPCVGLVPELGRCTMDEFEAPFWMNYLLVHGSFAAPFMDPEGIVVYHTAGNICFMKTYDNDEYGKGQ